MAAGGLGLQKQGGEGGAERQRVQSGDERGGGDGEGELAEELTHDARDERAGHEHRREHQADGDDGAGDFAHGDDGGLPGGKPAFHVVLDGLDDDDGVVDHDADGEHQAEEREVIDAEAHGQHDAEGADDADRNGDQGDHGGPPVLEEEQDDDGDEDDGFLEGLVDLLDGLSDEGGGVVADLVGHALGEGFGHLGDAGLDDVGDFEGVGVGQGEDAEAGGGAAVDAGVDVEVLGAQLDAGDVLEADHAAGGRGAEDDVAELLGSLEATPWWRG